MKSLGKYSSGVIFIIFLAISCETNPDISLYQKPIPVIYGIFDNKDSVHYIRVGKTFGADVNPAISAGICDSLYFENVELEVRITFPWDTVGFYPDVYETNQIVKDSGLFCYPNCRLFQFRYDFMYPLFFMGRVHVKAEIDDLPPAMAEIGMVTINRDSFSTPKFAQQYVFLNPENPFRVHWRGHYWNEIDVTFDFLENLGEYGTRVKTVHIQDVNYFPSPHDLYREMKITYDEFIAEVLQQIPKNDSVKETRLSYISIEINGGDHNLSRYRQYYDGYSDYNKIGYTNIQNGLGLLASRTSIKIDSMQFDRDTKRRLASENRLKVIKLVIK